ncbi:MAG: 4-(cytidine 5'-diphospho)-2-C-methyl-D-erythritol kinase [Candidatus Zixiibacteriota bacterium]|nr:MAG: 4-(cytidine 5'-diphospho)-2-C-methyl-D-erythritol kinase [candidate division Zixibacteria bacterium]
MILYPNAKINIGLKILNKRPDGYHNISSIFYPVRLSDILEFLPSSTGKFTFTQTGITIPGDSSDNLCVRVYEFFKETYRIPVLKIYLHKIIPTQAGLGGGSSDAAFLIKGINEYFNLDLSVAKMKEIALQFGSDCPFFIENKPAVASGKGEILHPFDLDLSAYHIIIVKPHIAISTAMAYDSIKPKENPIDSESLQKQSVGNWQSVVENDFESFTFSKFPELKEIKENLLRYGALFSQMTGSGSAVYGIFKKRPEIPNHLFANCKVFSDFFN